MSLSIPESDRKIIFWAIVERNPKLPIKRIRRIIYNYDGHSLSSMKGKKVPCLLNLASDDTLKRIFIEAMNVDSYDQALIQGKSSKSSKPVKRKYSRKPKPKPVDTNKSSGKSSNENSKGSKNSKSHDESSKSGKISKDSKISKGSKSSDESSKSGSKSHNFIDLTVLSDSDSKSSGSEGFKTFGSKGKSKSKSNDSSGYDYLKTFWDEIGDETIDWDASMPERPVAPKQKVKNTKVKNAKPKQQKRKKKALDDFIEYDEDDNGEDVGSEDLEDSEMDDVDEPVFSSTKEKDEYFKKLDKIARSKKGSGNRAVVRVQKFISKKETEQKCAQKCQHLIGNRKLFKECAEACNDREIKKRNIREQCDKKCELLPEGSKEQRKCIKQCKKDNKLPKLSEKYGAGTRKFKAPEKRVLPTKRTDTGMGFFRRTWNAISGTGQ